MEQKTDETAKSTDIQRRNFVKQSLIVTLSGVAAISMLPGCKDKEEEEGEGQEVSPPEDLMQEHGLLNRVLLIYDACSLHLTKNESFPRQALFDAATVIRTFVEDYHEKQEEQYLFPRFQKANQLTDLVTVLFQQHQAGRTITDQIIQLSKSANPTATETEKLVQLISSF